jgi:hypothetical protein
MTKVTPDTALLAIPAGLRKPLLEEFTQIVNNFMERRWGPAELSGGRFCEIVHTILHGHAQGTYAASPVKPPNFVNACRALENNTGVPRSFQILIPRILPALYEIRNNRNVGHVGSDVDPDFMDSSAVLAMASWIMGELIRVFHGISTDEAQAIVDNLAERRLPLVWKSGDVRRVLKPDLPLKDQILLLVSSIPQRVKIDDLFTWTGYKKRVYFNRLLRKLHDQRLIEFHEANAEVEMLPPGNEYVTLLLGK